MNQYKYWLLVVMVFLVSCKENHDKQEKKVNFEKAHKFYSDHINQSLVYIDSLAMYSNDDSMAKEIFKKLRIEFKKAEPFAACLSPEVGHQANGPALPFFTDDTQRVLSPIGLQKIEESIYEGGVPENVYQEEIKLTKGLLYVLKKAIDKRELTPQRFFVATHQQLMRVVSLAMAGFDTPVSQLSIQETAVSLNSLLYVYQNSIQQLIIDKNKKLNDEFVVNVREAVKYIANHPDFITFDRFTYTRDYLNPITRNWVAIRKASDLWEPSEYYPFNFDAPTFFEEDSFNKKYFAEPNNRTPSEAQIALGEKLFFDKNLSKNNDMSCVTCHAPSKAYIDGIKVSKDNQGGFQLRNTPTLINSAFQKAFFLDGRSTTLESQITGVFINSKEFDVTVHQFSTDILKDSSYVKDFKKVFGNVPSKNTDIIKAISSYVATLNGFSSKFDKNIRGEENTYTESEKRGYNLFMGKALCATCHFMPLTNGTVPPFFNQTEKEVIGVPKTNKNKELDDDFGFYTMYKEPIHKGMFKTPTLRNIELTAPYMHNGVYNTLEEVMDFYNKGGGAGLGFDLPHQTLPFDELNLSEQEIKDIIAFMKTLTDVI
ncbi:cytochrome c peroxidase [Wenyingzhuangia sp. chi5]|uniref:Cytochrome c peroxidase n=1 Tax=Wenyingzhuangia gilva TaxID=3057677 RepID=A0ABT8VSN9_9FLAO|nr:cytochrome c peroxidase [Wenyingzhuangia sp. chi5]MDO3694999.1 cytochrome c peroxidase [Wenyingzhuangia sp. chi5]